MKNNKIRLFLAAVMALSVSTGVRARDIDAASLNLTPSSGIASALAGVCPWINVSSESGLPNAASRITLRGELSENGTLPLILVDGVEMPLEVLDPGDIESIEVLKDAAAAIYGARAAAGAIIIKTKNSGKMSAENAQALSVNAFTGITAGGAYGIEKNGDVFRPVRLTQNYKVSARGGNDVFSYYVGGHYFGEDGLYQKSFGKGGFNNAGMLGNFNAKINKWLRYSVGFDYTYRQTDSPFWGGDGALFNAVAADQATPFVGAAAAPYVYDEVNSHYVMMKNSLNASITKGLDLEISYAFSNLYDFRTSRSSEVGGVDPVYAPNFFSEIRDRETDNNIDGRLSYEYEDPSGHSVSAAAGMDMQFGNYKHVPVDVGSLIDESISALTIGDGNFDVDERKGQYFQTGIYVNGKYSYRNRYEAGLTVRADGTSRLPKQNRWAASAALALGWTISNEDFMREAGDVVDLLKLRYTFGYVADEALPSYYSYIPSVDNKKGKSQFLFDRAAGLPYYAGLNYPVFDNLAPERVMSHNVGVDAAFLGSRLAFSGDFFYRKVSDMLTASPNISAVFGDVPQAMNYGEASTTGFELSLGWSDRTNDFSYSVKAMFADHITTLTAIPDPRLSYALTGSLGWKNLEFSFLFDGVGKYSWPTGKETVDASYFGLRNVSLGYTLPFKEDSKVKSLHFGIVGRNLFFAGSRLPADFLFSTGGTGGWLPMTALLNIGINF